MAKKINPESLISVELQKFESKLAEFQSYLAQNTIVTKVMNNDQIVLSPDSQDQLHKEIVIQIKMQDAVLNWLPLLEKLKETEAAKVETRGGNEINGLFKSKNK